MKFDLIRPCDHCPFRTDEGRIELACRERAEEIDELVYRQGFVCHKHGENFEDEDSSYIDFRDDGSSQHCFGALFMYLRDGDATVPWGHATDADAELEERWWGRLSSEQLSAAMDLVFESPEDFIEANA